MISRHAMVSVQEGEHAVRICRSCLEEFRRRRHRLFYLISTTIIVGVGVLIPMTLVAGQHWLVVLGVSLVGAVVIAAAALPLIVVALRERRDDADVGERFAIRLSKPELTSTDRVGWTHRAWNELRNVEVRHIRSDWIE